MTDTTFVTGGTGFLGGAIVQRLVALGRPVKALVAPRGARALRALGGGARARRRSRPPHAPGGDARLRVVYHAAGVNAFCFRDTSPLFEVNVQGSLNVVQAAADAGARVVYTSSAATLGEARGSQGTESSPHRGSFLSSYERSKFEAEHAVLAAAQSRGIEVVSVNPASVQGPGRATGTTSAARLPERQAQEPRRRDYQPRRHRRLHRGSPAGRVSGCLENATC